MNWHVSCSVNRQNGDAASPNRGEEDGKMARSSKIGTVVVAVALSLLAGHAANGQGLKQELMKGIVKSLGSDSMQAMVTQVASEVAKNPELRRQILEAMGPEAAKAMAASMTANSADATSRSSAQLPSRGPVRGQQAQAATKNPAPVASQKPEAPRAARNEPGEASNSRPVNLGPLAIVVNPSNPVNALTVDQVRKLVSGEYTNWSQVGGPDRAVKVVTVRGGRASAENFLQTTLAPSTKALAFNSFIIPAVDQYDGAIGLIPTSTLEQVDFIGKHDAVKVIGVKKDNTQSPAVAPSRMAVFTGSYPMM